MKVGAFLANERARLALRDMGVERQEPSSNQPRPANGGPPLCAEAGWSVHNRWFLSSVRMRQAPPKFGLRAAGGVGTAVEGGKSKPAFHPKKLDPAEKKVDNSRRSIWQNICPRISICFTISILVSTTATTKQTFIIHPQKRNPRYTSLSTSSHNGFHGIIGVLHRLRQRPTHVHGLESQPARVPLLRC